MLRKDLHLKESTPLRWLMVTFDKLAFPLKLAINSSEKLSSQAGICRRLASIYSNAALVASLTSQREAADSLLYKSGPTCKDN